MVISVPRNSGLFTEPVADELNKAFYSINDKIEKYESKDLDFKEDVQYLSPDSNSFKGGNVISFRDGFTIDKAMNRFTKVGNIMITVPYDVWTWATTEYNESMFIHIKGREVFAYGNLSYYPQIAYLCTDIVVPNA